jgi:hypothetical protein
MATTCKCGGKTVTVKPKRASAKRVTAKKVKAGGTVKKGAGKQASALSKKLSRQATAAAKKNAKGCACSKT